jgi:predicted enzyme related to lactoylglutathione lyase
MLRIECLTIDARDPASLAAFWASLLEWEVSSDDEGEYWISPDRDDPSGRGTAMLFLPSEDPRTGKNRLHLDLRPDDQVATVDTAIGLGARRVDIGQTGEETWVVLADPEGNEFCVLRALPSQVPEPEQR